MEHDRRHDREWLEGDLARQGVAAVERRLEQGVYGEHNKPLVREWLEEHRGPPQAPRSRLNLARLVPSLPIRGIRGKPGKVLTWAVLLIVVIEVLSMLIAAFLS
jgi:hypothetical protein